MSSAVSASRVDVLLAALSRAPAIDCVVGDGSGFAVDDELPDGVVTPRSIEQLQRVLSEARKLDISVVAVGGGTHLSLGNVPESYDLAVSTIGLGRIVAHEPADLTVTAEAGVRVADLQRTLAEHGQRLPIDAAGSAASTVGGLLALNAQGPLRHAYGTVRDWLIGLRVVHADGTLTKSGGRVVKNVTGYDMHKLHIGALGTLGVIAEATFKLAPLPQKRSTVTVSFASAHAGSLFVLAMNDAGLAVEAAELLSPTAAHRILDRSEWCVLLRVAGVSAAHDRTLRDASRLATTSGALLEECDETAWERWSDAFAPGALSLRISVLPSSVSQTIAVLDRRFAGAGARLSSTVTAGVIRVGLAPSPETRAPALIEIGREVATRYDGAMVVEAAPAWVKREIDVFGPPRPDFAIMRRLKEQFDPARMLSPGRFVGRL